MSSSDSGHGSHLLSTPSLFRLLLKADRRTGQMCLPQASLSRGGMNLLLFGGYHNLSLTFIHRLTNHLQRAYIQEALVLDGFTGITGWVPASLVLLHHIQSCYHKELSLELFKEFLPKMTGLWFLHVWLSMAKGNPSGLCDQCTEGQFSFLSTLRGSPSVIEGQFGFHSSAML